MSDENEATFSDLVNAIERLAVAINMATKAQGERMEALTGLATANLEEDLNLETGTAGDDDLDNLDLNSADDDEENLTPQQRGARTRAANKAKKDAVAAAGAAGGDAQANQPDVKAVQAKLKELAAEYQPDDSPEGKQTGREVAIDLLSRYGVDSVNKLELKQYAPLLKQADELIAANQITSDDDPLGLDDDGSF